jgi:general secretion pathway protein M
MKEWFEQLEQRERLLVAAAGVLVIIALVVLLIIQPISSQTSRGLERVTDKRALLTELEQVAQRIGPQAGGVSSVIGANTDSLVVVVDQTTRSAGLAAYLKRNQPDGANSIRLRFENAPFDTIVEWLAELDVNFSMSATSANIDMAADPGRVNCNFTLARAGA